MSPRRTAQTTAMAASMATTLHHGGTVTLRCCEREASATQELSGLCDRVPPRGHRRSAKRTVGLG